jgi:hypothetical protein
LLLQVFGNEVPDPVPVHVPQGSEYCVPAQTAAAFEQ